MSLPYFNLYPTDFEADTSHLSLEEDGAYNRLLRLCWMTPGCCLPDDDAWIMRRMRVDQATYDRVVTVVLAEFFTRKMGRVSNARLRREFEKADETYRKRSEAGKKGGRPKAIDNKEKEQKAGLSQSKAGPKQPEPEPEPYKKEEAKASLSPDSDVTEAVAAYNAAADQAGWPRVQVINKARKASLKARLSECGGLDGWQQALARARASPHCCGQNERGWTASFDFLTQAKSFAKLMEGNYDQRTNNGSHHGMASSARSGGGGQITSLASIAARRRADGQV